MVHQTTAKSKHGRASEASETLSGLNNENRSYTLFICMYECIILDTSLNSQALHKVGRVKCQPFLKC